MIGRALESLGRGETGGYKSSTFEHAERIEGLRQCLVEATQCNDIKVIRRVANRNDVSFLNCVSFQWDII